MTKEYQPFKEEKPERTPEEIMRLLRNDIIHLALTVKSLDFYIPNMSGKKLTEERTRLSNQYANLLQGLITQMDIYRKRADEYSAISEEDRRLLDDWVGKIKGLAVQNYNFFQDSNWLTHFRSSMDDLVSDITGITKKFTHRPVN